MFLLPVQATTKNPPKYILKKNTEKIKIYKTNIIQNITNVIS